MNEIENDNLESNCVPNNSSSKKLFKDHLNKNVYSEKQMSDALESLHMSGGSGMRNGTRGHELEDGGVGLQRGVSPTTPAPLVHLQPHHLNMNSNTSRDCYYGDAHASTSKIHLVRNLVEEALENFENSLRLQEQPLDNIEIISYESELQMPEIMRLIQKDLSEPYSIYTYRFFIHNWPKLCFLAIHTDKCIGAIVCKLDMHRNVVKRGYIAMLAVDENYRKKKIGSRLVQKAIEAMLKDDADEVVLETEITNKPALKLYENLGFVRDKRLFRYYLNGVDALRLKLWLR